MYFRRGRGKRIPLPGQVGSEEFLIAYQAALSGEEPAKVEKRQGETPGTIAYLIASYMRSAAYIGLRKTTKAGYASRIEALRTKHGHRTVAGLTKQRITSGILDPYADRPGAAHSILKMLRILIKHAIDKNMITQDPTIGIKRPKLNEIRAWTEAEIKIFESKWPLGTKQRTAFALMLYTGQRRSDVHRMTWADVSSNSIRVVQQKTGARLEIPIHPDLREALASANREHLAIVTTAYGTIRTVDGFSQWMREAISEAGLPIECQPHGLRKAAGRRLAEAGCSAHEIMAVLGHKTSAEAERYTREADQAKLAQAAILKLQGRTKN